MLSDHQLLLQELASSGLLPSGENVGNIGILMADPLLSPWCMDQAQITTLDLQFIDGQR